MTPKEAAEKIDEITLLKGPVTCRPAVESLIQQCVDDATAELREERDEYKKSYEQEAANRASMVRTARKVAVLETKLELKAENAELRAAVDRLPKDADGMPIGPLAPLYSRYYTSVIPELVVHELHGCVLHDLNEWHASPEAAAAAGEAEAAGESEHDA